MPVVAWIATIGLVIVALLLALFGLQQRSKVQNGNKQTQQIETVAGQTVAALTTYDYQNLDAWKKAVLAHATGTFQDSFNNAVEGVKLLLGAAHNRSTSTIQNVFIGPVNNGKATAAAVVNVTVTGLSGTRLMSYLQQVTLLKVAGQWRVDNIQVSDLTQATAGSGTAPGTGPTPTTHP
jgi:Mce-associated membrane protein